MIQYGKSIEKETIQYGFIYRNDKEGMKKRRKNHALPSMSA